MTSSFEAAIKNLFLEETKKVEKKTALKKKIVNKKLNKKLNENMFGAGSQYSNSTPGSLSISGGANNNNNRSQMPPYSAYTNLMTDPQTPIDMKDTEDAASHQAPKRRPYPLETVQDHMASAYQDMTKVENLMGIAIGNPSISKQQNSLLKDLVNNVKAILGNIKKTCFGLEKISF